MGQERGSEGRESKECEFKTESTKLQEEKLVMIA